MLQTATVFFTLFLAPCCCHLAHGVMTNIRDFQGVSNDAEHSWIWAKFSKSITFIQLHSLCHLWNFAFFCVTISPQLYRSQSLLFLSSITQRQDTRNPSRINAVCATLFNSFFMLIKFTPLGEIFWKLYCGHLGLRLFLGFLLFIRQLSISQCCAFWKITFYKINIVFNCHVTT